MITIFFIISNDSCGVNHLLIVNDLKSYEKSFDPEFCEDLLERIELFNDRCQPQIEILDCG